MIRVRFDIIHRMSTKDADRLLMWANLPQVPSPGELINLQGHPYVIHTRDWALGDEESVEGGQLYAYVRLLDPNRGGKDGTEP